MTLELFSAQWAVACCAHLNQSAAYREAAAGWEWPLVLLLTPTPADAGPDRAVWFDLYHGQCRAARSATPDDLASAPFVIAADLAGWQRVLDGGLDPLAALMLGKLKLRRGSLGQLAPYALAAKQLVNSARAVVGRQ